MNTPAADGFRMPAEWAPHARCWMAWPCRAETFKGDLDGARAAYADVARTVALFEPVTVVCNPSDVAEASIMLGDGIQVVPMDLSDSWMRDIGPTFVRAPDGRLAGIDWRFNAWGEKYADYAADAALAAALLDRLNVPRYEPGLVCEGGAIHTDGEGTVLTTESVLLNANRNPGLDKAAVEAVLRDSLGATTVIWLGAGYDQDETDGHVDEIACFARPGVVLITDCDDPADPNAAVVKDMADRLAAARDAAGRELEIVRLPQPHRREIGGVRLTLSYTNLYIANGGVIMPAFEDPADEDAFRILRRVFADREVVQVPALDIVKGDGGIHCITQQQPA